jgi:hypothetical protein
MKFSPPLPERILSLHPSIECKYTDFCSLVVCSLQVTVFWSGLHIQPFFFFYPRNHGVMLGLYLTKAGSWFLVVHTLLKICNVVILIIDHKLPDQPKRLLFTSISRLGFCLPNFSYVRSIWVVYGKACDTHSSIYMYQVLVSSWVACLIFGLNWGECGDIIEQNWLRSWYFPSPNGYMLTSFGVSLFIWVKFSKFFYNDWLLSGSLELQLIISQTQSGHL